MLQQVFVIMFVQHTNFISNNKDNYSFKEQFNMFYKEML